MVKLGRINRNFPELKGKQHDLNKYVAAFAIATLMFVVGLFVGATFVNQKIAKINTMEEAMKFDLASVELQDMLIRQEPCSPIASFEEELADMESKISYMEDQLGKKDAKVIDLKKYYSIIELKHYLLMNERKGKCGGNYSLILFFYSNADEALLDSEKQGYVLDSIRRGYGPEKVKIYSLDKDLDLDIIRTFVELYKIKDAPTLVIGSGVYPGFKSLDEMRKILSLPVLPESNLTGETNSTFQNASGPVIVLK
jgi:hypothetical protein